MILIGMDFSIQSPGICIEYLNEFSFITIQRKIKEDYKEILNNSGVFVEEIQEKENFKGTTITEIERGNSKDALLLSNTIYETIFPYFLEDHNIKIGIEGLSFMSRGNIISQFSGYHYVLRNTLNKIIPFDNQFLFSPSSIKKLAGKGNFKKDDMINAFLKENDNNNELLREIKKTPEKFQNRNGKWKKPLDDLVDSYWVLKKLKEEIKE